MNVKIHCFIDTENITEAEALSRANSKIELISLGSQSGVVDKMYYISPMLGRIMIVVSDADKLVLKVISNVLHNGLITDYALDRLPGSIIEYKEVLVNKETTITQSEAADIAQAVVADMDLHSDGSKVSIVKLVNYNTDDIFLFMSIIFGLNTFHISGDTIRNSGDAINGQALLDIINFTGINLGVIVRKHQLSTSPIDNIGVNIASNSTKVLASSIAYSYPTVDYAGIAVLWDHDFTTETILNHPDPVENDEFGYSIAMNESTIAIGTPLRDINGNSNVGIVYIFDTDGNYKFSIQASDWAANYQFGYRVAMNNSKIFVGCPQQNGQRGAVYMYNLDGSGEIKISSGSEQDLFGSSVAATESKIIIGAISGTTNIAGAAYIYDIDGSNYIKVTPSNGDQNDTFGYSVSINDTKVVVGSPFHDAAEPSAGALYVYDIDGTNEQILIPLNGAGSNGQKIGSNVDMNDEYIVTGAEYYGENGSHDGTVYTYSLDDYSETVFKPTESETSYSHFGKDVSIERKKIFISAYKDIVNGIHSGSIYIIGN